MSIDILQINACGNSIGQFISRINYKRKSYKPSSSTISSLRGWVNRIWDDRRSLESLVVDISSCWYFIQNHWKLNKFDYLKNIFQTVMYKSFINTLKKSKKRTFYTGNKTSPPNLTVVNRLPCFILKQMKRNP